MEPEIDTLSTVSILAHQLLCLLCTPLVVLEELERGTMHPDTLAGRKMIADAQAQTAKIGAVLHDLAQGHVVAAGVAMSRAADVAIPAPKVRG